MDAKHQFKYTYKEGCEDFSPVEVTFEVPGDATLTQMLYNFERYLEAAGFVFSGKLDFVEDTYPEYLDEIEQEPGYGCMADFDKECGCKDASSALEDDEYYKSKKLKEWNEGIAKLDNEQKQKCREEALKMSGIEEEASEEVKKNRWFHGLCNPPSPDWKKK